MNHFKTPAGTELPFLNLQGNDYLRVAHRILWMREETKKWSIGTEVINLTEDFALFKCTIKDENEKLVATAHGSETAKGFRDFIEKAETVSIGRALGIAGFGTQFAQELAEIDSGKLADAPLGTAIKKSHDTAENHQRTYNQANVSQGGKYLFASDKQMNRLHAIAKHAGYNPAGIASILSEKWQVYPGKLIASKFYDEACAFFEKHPVETQEFSREEEAPF